MEIVRRSPTTASIKSSEVDEMAEILGSVTFADAKSATLKLLGPMQGLVTLAKLFAEGEDLEKTVKDLTAQKEALENAGKLRGEEIAAQLKAKGDELSNINRKIAQAKDDFEVSSAQMDNQLDVLEGKRANLDLEVKAEFDKRLRALDGEYQARENELKKAVDDLVADYQDAKMAADSEEKRLADVTAKIEALKAKL